VVETPGAQRRRAVATINIDSESPAYSHGGSKPPGSVAVVFSGQPG